MSEAVMQNGEKFERKYLAHFIDDTFGGTTPDYIRLGKDLQQYLINMNPETKEFSNIIGESSFNVTGFKPSSSVDTFYAYYGDPLFERLSSIINTRATGSQLNTTVIDVLFSSTGTVIWAYKEDVVVVPQSIGGEDGVQIPFEIHYNGNRTPVTGTMSGGKFTITTSSGGSSGGNGETP